MISQFGGITIAPAATHDITSLVSDAELMNVLETSNFALSSVHILRVDQYPSGTLDLIANGEFGAALQNQLTALADETIITAITYAIALG